MGPGLRRDADCNKSDVQPGRRSGRDYAMTIIEACDSGDIERVRALFRAYAASLPFSLAFQGFAAELVGLPEPYSPPGGCLLIAKRGSEAVGVIGLKPLASGVAEIKRLYVVPEAPGLAL